MRKTPQSEYKFALRWGKMTFGVWSDAKRGLWFVNRKIPKGAKNVYTLAKRDSTVNLDVLKKADPLARLLVEFYNIGGLRYDAPSTREAFFEILSFFGVK